MWLFGGRPVSERGERCRGGGAGFRVERRREWRDVVSSKMVVFQRRESEIWRAIGSEGMNGGDWMESYGSDLGSFGSWVG
ncbi:hypothetical protein HAX54_037125 [Datura stramonium]|uniref:Uncharacterized protein n=1 Tax=Datura stramonium TaxID=4076 RepID=A0ABS8VLQ9_DATST|nr:hypothetical protein [Datura stramonium]